MRIRSVTARAVLALAVISAVTLVSSCATLPPKAPYLDSRLPVEARVEDLLAQMTLEEKVGQMTQANAGSLADPADIEKLALGSLLSGGDDMPSPNTPTGWADAFDRYQRIALTTRLGIPLLYGVDSVHGFSHSTDTTIFPHNIGLGAARDPALVQEIGRVTALEMAGTGIRWTFSPCLAVVQDERWGRTYESFGESPELVSSMTSLIAGYQGTEPGLPTSLLATAKHFMGDGGTEGGRDQGNTAGSEEALLAVHLPPYKAALDRGVGAVMISYSSWNGQKMHGSRAFITSLLKEKMGFNGIVVSDWKGINQLNGAYAEQVAAGVNAGIDVAMAPDDYRTFAATLLNEVRAGSIPLERIDDAVRRILRAKFRMGLFEHPFAARQYLAQAGAPQNRSLARRAVRESVVVLKNDGNILPLPRTLKKILVVGKNADNLGCQLGGWSITWQGVSGKITAGTTILSGIREAVSRNTVVVFDRQGRAVDAAPRDSADSALPQPAFDVVIAVVGEKPYAEGRGDRSENPGLDDEDNKVLDRLTASGTPTVTVIVSGRPLVVTKQLPRWKALVEAWLPGTEGAGVADVLFGGFKPVGKLPVTWPRTGTAAARTDPLFPCGYGLTY
jgi:beta-glucosidase